MHVANMINIRELSADELTLVSGAGWGPRDHRTDDSEGGVSVVKSQHQLRCGGNTGVACGGGGQLTGIRDHRGN